MVPIVKSISFVNLKKSLSTHFCVAGTMWALCLTHNDSFLILLAPKSEFLSLSISIAVGVISLNSLVKGLTRELPKHRHHLIPLNEEAIKRGMEFVQQSMKGAHHG
jgi:hypothetical protein